MFHYRRLLLLILLLLTVFSSQLSAQEDHDWRIAPVQINVQVGEDRPLQLLNDTAEELKGAEWSVDNSKLGDLEEINGHQVLHSRAVGTLHVTAILQGQVRSREIKIWPADHSLPEGIAKWSMQDLGHEIRQLAAVPSPDGPNMYSLEQTDAGSTYLRAYTEEGFQLWAWHIPDETREVELVCGDWLGGALISVNRTDSYTLYAVGNDGNLRWQRKFDGIRKGFTINTDSQLYLLTQSVDGTAANLLSISDVSGATKFKLVLPTSVEIQDGVEKQGSTFQCSTASRSNPSRTPTSGLFVNMDGLPYLAFTRRKLTFGTAKCISGASLNLDDVYLERLEQLTLWQIRPDGTYRSTVVDQIKNKQSISAAVYTVSPAGGIMTDNMNGVLIPARWFDDLGSESASTAADDVVYRVAEDGQAIYKFPLPHYTGALHDGMVIREDEVAFATRGGILIAFNLLTGKELWRWDSQTTEISVFAALANGDCLVQTPTALVEVTDSTHSKEIAKGKAMIDWHGQIYMQRDN